MATYVIINSKTGKDVETGEFLSGGDAKKYAESLGRNYYAKRISAKSEKSENE